MKALDLSNFTTNVPGFGAPGGVITDDLVACWRREDYDLAIVGTQWLDLAKHQLDVCMRGGMAVDVYSYLTWARPGGISAYMEKRVFFGETYPIKTHWLDCEDAIGNFSPDAILDKIDLALDTLGDQPSGIYTGLGWWWGPSTGNSTDYSYLPLWNANYVYPRVPAVSEFKPAFGWDHVTIWQYGGSVQLCGANMDLNIVADGYLPGNGEPPDMSDQDKIDLTVLDTNRRFERVLNTPVGVGRIGRYHFVPGERDSVILKKVVDGAGVEVVTLDEVP